MESKHPNSGHIAAMCLFALSIPCITPRVGGSQVMHGQGGLDWRSIAYVVTR